MFPHSVDLPFVPAASSTGGFRMMLRIGDTVGEFVIFIGFLWIGVGTDLSKWKQNKIGNIRIVE
jgi:hypothetical protein